MKFSTLTGGVLLVLLMSGCSGASAPAGETQAVPAARVSPESAEVQGEGTAAEQYPEVPTSLLLSEDEEQAAREALVKVDDFYSFAHRLLQSGGKDDEGLSDVAADKVRGQLSDVALDFRENGEALAHPPFMRSRDVERVALGTEGSTIPYVTVGLCAEAAAVEESPAAEDSPVSGTSGSPGDTFRHTATVAQFRMGWRVTALDVVEERC